MLYCFGDLWRTGESRCAFLVVNLNSRRNAMWFFYVFALLPVLVGAFLLWKDEEVVWWEWLTSAGVAFLIAVIMHMTAVWGMTSDVETWSGVITKVSHMPRWVEEYQQAHTRRVATGRDKDGNTTYTTETYYTTEHATHPEHWEATRNFGTYEDDINIERHEFDDITKKFGGRIEEDGSQSCTHGGHFDGGDNGIYSAFNYTGYVEPTTTTRSFENRVKAAPSVFSFTKVPTNINVYPWPNNPDWRKSDRLLGTATVLVDRYKWDCMNSSLGPRKRVNVILVGFGKEPADYAQYQQAKWIGGKKNDLVLCFGGATRNQPAQWSYVFGWTENEMVKKNLQTILLQNPINDNIIPLIAEEVAKNYVIKDWHKFDYISIDPPTWSYWVYFIMMALVQGGLYYFFHVNEYGKSYGRMGYGGYRWRY